MRITIGKIKKMKRDGEKIPMITAYDHPSARLAEEAGIPIVFVGDSLGQVVLGYELTLPVTMDEMLHHVKAVVRGTEKAHIVVDMPFMSYQADAAEAMRNAGRLLKEGGAQSVKLEGGRRIAGTVERIVEAGIPVMGHIGLTPQSINQLSGHRVQGKTPEAAARLLDDAIALEQAGVYSIVLELVPAPLAKLITERVSVPTIGIGAGPYCDGQVQVFHDILGLSQGRLHSHSRVYAAVGDAIKAALSEYADDVTNQRFPTDENAFPLDQSIVDELVASAAG